MRFRINLAFLVTVLALPSLSSATDCDTQLNDAKILSSTCLTDLVDEKRFHEQCSADLDQAKADGSAWQEKYNSQVDLKMKPQGELDRLKKTNEQCAAENGELRAQNVALLSENHECVQDQKRDAKLVQAQADLLKAQNNTAVMCARDISKFNDDLSNCQADLLKEEETSATSKDAHEKCQEQVLDAEQKNAQCHNSCQENENKLTSKLMSEQEQNAACNANLASKETSLADCHAKVAQGAQDNFSCQASLKTAQHNLAKAEGFSTKLQEEKANLLSKLQAIKVQLREANKKAQDAEHKAKEFEKKWEASRSKKSGPAPARAAPAPAPASCGLVAFKSVMYPDKRIVHESYHARIRTIKGDEDEIDPQSFEFYIRNCEQDLGNCGNDRCVSLESHNSPRSFLRNKNYNLHLQEWVDNSRYHKDVSFCMRRALSGKGVSLESVNVQNYYISSTNGLDLMISEVKEDSEDADAKKDVSFLVEHLPCSTGSSRRLRGDAAGSSNSTTASMVTDAGIATSNRR